MLVVKVRALIIQRGAILKAAKKAQIKEIKTSFAVTLLYHTSSRAFDLDKLTMVLTCQLVSAWR
jgi:hypothetical protein